MAYYIPVNDCEVVSIFQSPEAMKGKVATIYRKSDEAMFTIGERVGCILNNKTFRIEKFSFETGETYIIGGEHLLPLRNAKKIPIEMQ